MERMSKDFGEVKFFCDFAVNAEYNKQTDGDGTVRHNIRLSWKKGDAKPEYRFTARLSLEMMSGKYLWYPCSGMNKNMATIWRNEGRFSTTLATACPAVCVLDDGGNAVHTVWASEISRRININSGSEEETGGRFTFEVSMQFSELMTLEDYSITISENSVKRPFGDSLDAVRLDWEKSRGIEPMEVPESARMPMYSTWYSYHQDINDKNVEHECKNAAALGMDSVIADDGWQLVGNMRGYAYTGDWNVSEEKFPDFAKHVENVHKLGMKYILWFGVPFAGYNSELFKKFSDKVLCMRDDLKAAILDPRYKEVRKCITDKYVYFAENYKLDGFKLDFIDSFCSFPETPFKEGMDIANVSDALENLMTGVKDALQSINPDVMIEFRQSYTGPVIRRFGNMLRVADCPHDGVTNRVGIADIRVISGQSAVHSDMIMWDKNCDVKDAAWQILNSIFGVIQYSMRIDDLPGDHKAMSKFWLKFARDNAKTLQCGKFEANEPQYAYPVIRSYDENNSVTAVYTKNKIIDTKISGSVKLINASPDARLVLNVENAAMGEMKIYDCTGKLVRDITEKFLPGIKTIDVPVCGLASIDAAKA